MIEAARVPACGTPVDDFLCQLERDGRDGRLRLADLAIRFEDFARTGTLQVPRELRDLRDGIREIKAGDVRVLFFDTACSSKPAVRLTNGFRKRTQKTPRRSIDQAMWVRGKDLRA